MVDFVALLKKSIETQKNPTPQLRQKIYERAREAMARKLAEKTLPDALVKAQKKMLEDAVIVIENEYNEIEKPAVDTRIETKAAKTATTPDAATPDTAPEKKPEMSAAKKTTPAAKKEQTIKAEPEAIKAEPSENSEVKAEKTSVDKVEAAALDEEKPKEPPMSKGSSRLREAIKLREQQRQKGETVESKSYIEKRKPLSFDFSLPQKKEKKPLEAEKSVSASASTPVPSVQSAPDSTADKALHYDDELKDDAIDNSLPEDETESNLAEEKDTDITAVDDAPLQGSNVQMENISVAALDDKKLQAQPDVVKTKPNKYTDPQAVIDVENILDDASTDGEDQNVDQTLNIDDAVSSEKQYVSPESSNNKKNENLLEISPQTGDFDIVSDIFTQAARRSERQAAKKRFMIIVVSIVAFVLIVAIGLFSASQFLTNKQNITANIGGDTQETTEQGQKKLTERLLSSGEVVDAGEARDSETVGEGVTTAESNASPDAEQLGDAIFYRARTETANEKVETGSVHWSLVNSGQGGADDAAVRGDISIPNEGFSLQMTLRRNLDASLPAAYLLELIFKAPAGFEGRAIDRVHELSFKPSEQTKGQELSGAVYAKFDDNYFLYALSATKPYPNTNLEIMRNLNWIRMVLSDKDGRFIELTFSKGPTGEQIFQEVLDKWLQQENAPTVYDQNINPNNSQAN